MTDKDVAEEVGVTIDLHLSAIVSVGCANPGCTEMVPVVNVTSRKQLDWLYCPAHFVTA